MWLFLVNTSMRFSDSGWINPWTMRIGSVQTTKGEETVLRGRCSKAKSDQLGIRSQFACPDFHLITPWLVEWYEMYMLFPHEDAAFLFRSIALRAVSLQCLAFCSLCVHYSRKLVSCFIQLFSLIAQGGIFSLSPFWKNCALRNMDV